MSTSIPKELAKPLQKAKEYLDSLTGASPSAPDAALLQKYLTDISPYLKDDPVSSDLLRTAARLCFALERYQEAAKILKRLRDPSFNRMRLLCDCHNGYFVCSQDWISRQEQIWKRYEEKLPYLSNQDAQRDLQDAWEPYFPISLVSLIPLSQDNRKGLVLLGNPDGIYSLFPMNYLFQHMPDAASGPWEVIGEFSQSPDIIVHGVQVNGTPVETGRFAVRITPSTAFHVESVVDLTFWHPALREMIQQGDKRMAEAMVRYHLGSSFPFVVTALYVDNITVAEEPFGTREDVVLLDNLKQWFRDHGMDPDISSQQILRKRVYAFTREPAMASRPRGDILRGETCMPELEEIYFLRNAKGPAIFQRYGVGYWFLTIPKAVSGEDFLAFRDNLIQAVRAREQDTVCFTGWAEGTRHCYIDFLSLSGSSILDTLQRYCMDLPGGGDIRISSFYWNAVPRTLDYSAQRDELAQLEASADPVSPPKDVISAKSRAKLEKAFQETRWERTGRAPDWDVDGSSPYDEAKALLTKAVQHVGLSDKTGLPIDYSLLHSILEDALPKGDASDADDILCERLSAVLLTLERYRESAYWMARTKPGADQTTRLYTCDLGSGYPVGTFQLENRRQAFWKQFAAAEADLAQSITGGGDPKVLQQFRVQADTAFPFQEAVLCSAGGKNTLLTGLPGGILTLPGMLYFTSHYPANIGKRWNIAVSWDGAPQQTLPVGGETISTQDIQVSLLDMAGTVSLSLWHPRLFALSQDSAQKAKVSAIQLVNAVLPIGARLLYVEEIRVATELHEDAFPLLSLRQQMRERGYLPDIPLGTLLSHRKYTIAREPKASQRPRDDILRGETCMPELECIYYRLYEEGLVSLERHGLFAMFLMIPNALCNGDPAQYRQQLQRYLIHAEGDKVFFTGWAEGTQYTYLDLISMDGSSIYNKMNEYALSNPGGKDLRFCSFYWNCPPRPWVIWDAQSQMLPDMESHLEGFAKGHRDPDFPVPGIAAAAELEASFQRTFYPEDFCTARPPAEPASASQSPAAGKKKLSKAQRKAQSGQSNGKNGKKKR